MKYLDIESIGKKMPYSTPDRDFFERITDETISRVEQAERSRITIRRAMITITSIAAAVIVAFVALAPMSRPTYEAELAQLDLTLDAYFNELSDDEISTIATLSDTEIIQYIN